MVPRGLSPICRRFETLGRRVRACLFHWLATGAVIAESDGGTLEERELQALSEAIDRARRDGR